MKMENQEMISKGHVVILPFPAQGHINPMLQFAKRLASKGIKATLANTIAIYKSMPAYTSSSIQIETISDGFDDGGYAQAQSADVYLSTLKVVGSQTLENLLHRLKDSSDSPVTALIYDAFLPWALDIAKQFGLIGVAFLTQSCAVNIMYDHVLRGLLPLPLSGPTVSLPGLPLLQASEVSSFISDYGSYPAWSSTLFGQFSNIDEADWVLCSSYYELEEEAADWMAKRWRLGTIGPTLPSKYLDKRVEDDDDYGINLFKPDTNTCMNWLQDKPNGSVVYMSFGSMAELGEEQMEELAQGLKRSNCYFLWIVRATEQCKLPSRFIEEISEKGLVVEWCPQLEVLSHEAIGCFITHCGFNSVVEALSLGVPIVAVPQWTDQPTNAKYVEDVWKAGIRATPDEKGMVRREVLELCIREVMEREKGKEVKENARKWKKLAVQAIDEGGTSDKNIDKFVAKLSSS